MKVQWSIGRGRCPAHSSPIFPPEQSMLSELLLLFSNDPNSPPTSKRPSEGEKWWWWGCWGGAVLGPDQPKQTSLWGWATCMGAIVMEAATSLPQAKGREGTEGQWQKDREGAPRGDGRDEKPPHTTGAESGGPWASKVATGEKWRSNTVNAAAKVLNEAPCGPAGTVQTWCPLLQEEQLQNNEDKYFYKCRRSPFFLPPECSVRRAERHKEANGRASGRRGQAEGWAEYIVTLMRLSGSSWWSGCVFVPASRTPLNVHAVNPCWTLASRARPRRR